MCICFFFFKVIKNNALFYLRRKKKKEKKKKKKKKEKVVGCKRKRKKKKFSLVNEYHNFSTYLQKDRLAKLLKTKKWYSEFSKYMFETP